MSHNHMKKPKPGDPWMPIVDVILHPDTQTFEFKSSDIDIGPKNSIIFQNDAQPGFVVTFRLQGPPNEYRFPENLAEALWVTEDADCPTEKNNGGGPMIAKAVNNNGLDLVVRNKNKDKETFSFAPRVSNDGGRTFWNLDPVGSNENGSWGRNVFSADIGAVIGGFVGGVLVTLGVEQLMGLNPFG